VALENQVAQAVSANQVESVNQAARVVSENRVVPAQLRDRAARVVVDRAQCRPVGRAAAAMPIVSVVISLPVAGAAARSVAEVPTSLGPVAAEAVPAWAAVDSAVAEEAVAVAAVVDVAVAVDVVVVVVDAGDEQFSNGIKTYEIENKHHEAIKNFFTRLCDRHVRYGGIFIAGCARN